MSMLGNVVSSIDFLEVSLFKLQLRRNVARLVTESTSSKFVNCKYLIIHFPHGLFRNNLQRWLGDFARLLKVQFISNEGMINDAPIHECESEINHYTWHYVPYSLRRVCGFFNVSQI